MRSRTARITTLCATSPKVSKPECDKDGAECASLLAPIEKTQPPLPGFMSVARRTRLADVTAEPDPRLLAVDHENSPARLPACHDDAALIDGQAHRAAVLVEEAGVSRDHSGVGRSDLLYGPPRRGIPG